MAEQAALKALGAPLELLKAIIELLKLIKSMTVERLEDKVQELQKELKENKNLSEKEKESIKADIAKLQDEKEVLKQEIAELDRGIIPQEDLNNAREIIAQMRNEDSEKYFNKDGELTKDGQSRFMQALKKETLDNLGKHGINLERLFNAAKDNAEKQNVKVNLITSPTKNQLEGVTLE